MDNLHNRKKLCRDVAGPSHVVVAVACVDPCPLRARDQLGVLTVVPGGVDHEGPDAAGRDLTRPGGVVLAAECSGPLTDPGAPSQQPLARPLRRAMTVCGRRWRHRPRRWDRAGSDDQHRRTRQWRLHRGGRGGAPRVPRHGALTTPRVRLGLFVCKKERC